MPAHDASSWLSRLWVAALPCYISCLLHDAYFWLYREWVATLPCHISCLLMMPVPGSPGSAWLLCLAIFYACSWCLILGSSESKWLLCHISCLLMMPLLDSLDCEWLLCLAIFHACSWCLFLALQRVSGYFALPYFMLAHYAWFWLSRLWVATVPCHISCLLMMPVFGSPACEWLLCLAIFHACSQCLLLALQIVSGCFACHNSCLHMMIFLALQEVSALSYFMPALDAYSWLSRKWVVTLPCHIPACSWCLFLALQRVSSYYISPVFCLLTMPVLGSSGSQWLLYLAIFMPAHDTSSWLSRLWVATLPCHI